MWLAVEAAAEDLVVPHFQVRHLAHHDDFAVDAGALAQELGYQETALAVLVREMVSLRREDRELLRSFYGGLKSCRETAQACEVPPTLVKIRLFRARKMLRAKLKRLS